MKILAESSLVDVLGNMFSELSNEAFYVIELEQKNEDHLRQDVVGLDIALEVASEGLPVVMLGWMTPKMYIERKSDKWYAAMGYQNVVFRRLPPTADDVRSALEEVKTNARQGDLLAIALLTAKQTEDTIGVLLHDLGYAQSDVNRMAQWASRARKIFGDKTHGELISLVENTKRNFESQFVGQVFPDVCVDVEGTLIASDGSFRSEVLTLAEEKANGGPITIWTGGDVSALTTQLRHNDVFYKVVSKHAMRGATVRVVIDDLTPDQFKDDYGIGCQEYIRV